MTETSDSQEEADESALALSPVLRRFILHWGEMGTRWGVNRTVAQIHALLFVSPDPLPAETIAATLGIARSNVSVSLRELISWGVVRRVHVLGDRRDRFASLADVWEMLRVVMDERKRREIDPTLAVLRECSAELAARPGRSGTGFAAARLADMLEFFEAAATLHREARALPTSALRRVARSARKLRRLLGGAAEEAR